jgi:ferredoxin
MHRIPLPQIVFDVDLVIDIAKMKTHGLTQTTLCVKNLYGCIPGNLKERLHGILPSPKEFSKLLVKIEEAIRPGLNIIDGVVGLEGEGPGASGKPIKSKIIVASKNAAAADFISSEIMGFNPKKIYTNKLSKIKREEIEVLGDGKDMRINFKKPKSHDIQFALQFLAFLPRPKITFDYNKCKQCNLCAIKCPAKAIKLNPWPKCDHKKCIRCLCCIEVCPHSAIYLKSHWFRQMLMNIYRKFKKV